MEKSFTVFGVAFWTEDGNFRRVQDYLKQQGFVNSSSWNLRYKDEPWFDDTLVYEEKGVGLFRCTFHRQLYPGSNSPNFEFKYWDNRLSSEQQERDPMRRFIFEIYKMLRPIRVTDYGCRDINLESLAEAGEL